MTISRDVLIELLLANAAPTHHDNPQHGSTSASSPVLLISVAEAALRMNVRPAHLYQHRAMFGFMTRVGTRALRVDERKLNAYIAKQTSR